ncbi:DUF3291 domain-containing protein [Aquimarina macrocephali]|uniref:DUF3291 domain-containing protein n=1 Tax=Aquimarina macrocephali TaxID=666563 RepID=UPI0004B675C2|nr:DUF3291 domain-containing protein [Aquimarina macrocephali]
MSKKYIAEINIAKMKAPLDSPLLKEFVDFLEPINKLADESPGFVWRLKDDDGSSAANIESPLEDDMMLINMSVWEDLTSLKNFAYGTVHSYFVRDGRKWFERMKSPHMVLWWIDRDHIPTTEEALSKLKHLEEYGQTSDAFNFKKIFNSIGEEI